MYDVGSKYYDGLIPIYETSLKFGGNLAYNIEIYLHCSDALFYLLLVTVSMPEVNVASKKNGPAGFDKFSNLPNLARHCIYCCHLNVVAEIFPDSIDDLPTKATKA